MKKSLTKKLFAFLLVVCIFSLNLLSIGASYNEFLSANGIEVSKTKYVTSVTRDGVTQTTMNESALKSLKKNLSKTSLTEHEKNIEILKTLGYHDETLAGMNPEDIDFMLTDVSSLQMQVAYMKANEDGTTVAISEEECLAAVEAQNAGIATAASDNDGWGNWTSSDGYLRMTISSAYIDPASVNGEKGWYYFHAWYEWLKMPTYRQVDAMSIAVPTCSWDTLNAANAYYSSMYYTGRDVNDNNVTSTPVVKTTQDLIVAPSGVYYSWDLPDNSYNSNNMTTFRIDYTQIYMRAKARTIYPTLETSITAYLRYVHTYSVLDITPSFGWNLVSGEIGVSLDAKFASASNDYYFNVNHTYKP